MTNEEILRKSIEKAKFLNKVMIGDEGRDCKFKHYKKYDWESLALNNSYYALIFSHKFAKAFWGEEKMCKPHLKDFGNHEGNCEDISWEYHLQQLVLCEKPLLYLKKFL